MARARRIQLPGLIRHVMSRGNGRMSIFLDEEDYRKFVYVLSDVVEEFELDCFVYCVMSNHYHVALRPTLPNLSEAIRHLNSRYAQWWNRRHGRVGHVFQGRFKDQIVQHEGYFRTLCRYVALNPVRAKLVEHPADWPWSSYAATVGLRPAPTFLAVADVLGQFGDEDAQLLQGRFAEYVLQGNGKEESADDRIRSKERILGDKSFKKYLGMRMGAETAPPT
jgi:putative transposase